MARPIFTHELIDPDFSWLICTFKENHPNYFGVEVGGLPIVMIHLTNDEMQRSLNHELVEEDSAEEMAKEPSEGPEESQ